MQKPIKERLAALKKSGFNVTKYREIKSGTQYKMLSPQTVRKLWPVIVIRDSLEEAVSYTEGVADMWDAVQRKMSRSLSALCEEFGVKVGQIDPRVGQAEKAQKKSRIAKRSVGRLPHP